MNASTYNLCTRFNCFLARFIFFPSTTAQSQHHVIVVDDAELSVLGLRVRADQASPVDAGHSVQAYGGRESRSERWRFGCGGRRCCCRRRSVGNGHRRWDCTFPTQPSTMRNLDRRPGTNRLKVGLAFPHCVRRAGGVGRCSSSDQRRPAHPTLGGYAQCSTSLRSPAAPATRGKLLVEFWCERKILELIRDCIRTSA